jgi:hypothetical protein
MCAIHTARRGNGTGVKDDGCGDNAARDHQPPLDSICGG